MPQSLSFKPLKVFPVARWRQSAPEVLSELREFFGNRPVIIRSSAKVEDSAAQSMAGAFLSIPNINTGDEDSLRNAIDQVIASYGDAASHDDVLVQEQVQEISMCGVVFTRDIDTFAPYYVVNYDTSGSFDSVTSGSGEELKTYIRMRTSPYEPASQELQQVIAASEELESLFDNDALDIEFAITESGVLYLLQVRPIATSSKRTKVADVDLGTLLYKLDKKVKKLRAPHPGLCGVKSMFSLMTDWNPAEIVGTRPRRLSLSLYKELVTDSVWAHQRHAYGYRDLRGYPLLQSFLGQPYVDVRVSLNSFVPRKLDERLGNKLVDYYADRLVEQPTDHDKVEFKIVHSCYYLNVSEKLKELLKFGFSELELDRIKYALLDLTNNVISSREGLYLQDLKKIEFLQKRYDEILNSDLSTIGKIYWLIEDCKAYGTLPFAGLARAGFIAMQFLHSLIELEIMTQAEFQAFMNSLNTVAKQLASDTHAFHQGQISKEILIEKYGHLRPGTYDILSRSYKESFDQYFSEAQPQEKHQEESEFSFSQQQRQRISESLVENGLLVDVDHLLGFIREAVEGREYGKFVFTRSLSKALEYIEKLGERHGVSREDMSFIDIQTIRNMYASLTHEDVRDVLVRESAIGQKSAEITGIVRLPQLIITEKDVYDFFIGEVEANFVTQKQITELIVLEENLLDEDLEGKIVFIQSADPGYDWIFSRNIGGLVTMYGGANSHMAIRCSELQIPAVIGCGEKNFEEWARSSCLSLDCGNRQVKMLR